ncbi:MAG: hypothetical protein Ct9H90mP13_04150 [Pseudomonadota bacterium]|nr:MAG: hypothetical protein Ct9H90mP13_04150 [Pseudomonadota bacterium]
MYFTLGPKGKNIGIGGLKNHSVNHGMSLVRTQKPMNYWFFKAEIIKNYGKIKHLLKI